MSCPIGTEPFFRPLFSLVSGVAMAWFRHALDNMGTGIVPRFLDGSKLAGICVAATKGSFMSHFNFSS